MAMLLSLELDTIIDLLGHDGSCPVEMPEPYDHVGFRMEEMQYIAYKCGYCLVPYCDAWTYYPDYNKLKVSKIPDPNYMKEVMAANVGLIVGEINENPHCVAWDKHLIHDPNGTRYELECFNMEEFYALRTL